MGLWDNWRGRAGEGWRRVFKFDESRRGFIISSGTRKNIPNEMLAPEGAIH